MGKYEQSSRFRFRKLKKSRKALLFIRKVSVEYGLSLPFTYVGSGILTNPRKQEPAENQTKRNHIFIRYKHEQ